MMQGRFAEAEESFKSYRFIALDQANPHDSLGELYITTGRYDEAERILGLGSRVAASEADFRDEPAVVASGDQLHLMDASQLSAFPE